MKKIIFTKQGYENLIKESNELKKTRIQAVAELKTYRDMGDLSENTAYRYAKQKLGTIDSRINYLQKTIDRAVVKEKSNNSFIDIGSKVTIKNNLKSFSYDVVGSHESDLSLHRISCFSPLGKSLLGKKKGDIIQVYTPSGIKKYIIENFI